MNKFTRTSRYVIFYVLILFSSCGDGSKQIEYFNITAIFAQDLKFGENTPIDSNLKMLLNYQFSDSCSGILYVPELTIIREDFSPLKMEKLSLPLSGLNSWKPKNLIPAKNLIEDFDSNLKDMTNPKIITIKSNGKIENSVLNEKYPNAIYITIDKIGDVINNEIIPKLCRGETNNFILVVSSENPHPIDSTPFSSNDIKYIFTQITDLNISPDNRIELIPSFLTQAFANNATIEEFGENGTRLGVLPIEEYFNQIVLSKTIKSIEVLDAKKNKEDKYWTIKIVEHHDVHN